MKAEATPEHLAKADAWATKIAEESVDIIAQAEALKETAKDLLADIKNRIAKGDCDGKRHTETELERLARSTEEWASFQSGFMAALKESLRSKVRCKNAERHWTTTQSMLSYRKAELERISG